MAAMKYIHCRGRGAGSECPMISAMWAWCGSRSSPALVRNSFLKSGGHSANARC